MFLMAKALLKKKGYDAKTHEGVIKLFSLKYVNEDTFNYETYLHLPPHNQNEKMPIIVHLII